MKNYILGFIYIIIFTLIFNTGCQNIPSSDAISNSISENTIDNSSSTMLSEYTIEFHVNGGNQIDNISLPQGNIIHIPFIFKESYIFDGWYLDSDFNTEFTSDYMPGYNLELYANWRYFGYYNFEFALNEDGNSYQVIHYPGVQERIIVPDSYEGKPITAIGYGGFSLCPAVEIRLPSTITKIDSHAFSNCHRLKTINFPEGLISIGDSAFEDTFLSHVTFPNTLISIGSGAFSRSNLREVNLPESLESIDVMAFAQNPSLESIFIPKGVKTINPSALYCHGLTEITVDEENPYFSSVNGDLYSKDGKTLLQFATGKTATSYTLSEGVTAISDIAFRFASNIDTLILPEGLTYIGKKAFQSTTFKAVILPSTLETIDEYAFLGCGSLEQLIIPDGVTTIGRDAFSGCSKLINIQLPKNLEIIEYRLLAGCHSLKSIVIGNAVTTIGASAFSNCNSLKGIVIGKTVTTIGASAFNSCTSLVSIIFEEESQLNFIGENAFKNCTKMDSITIQRGVTTVELSAFYGWTSWQRINILISNQPEGWSNNWKDNCMANVIWYQ